MKKTPHFSGVFFRLNAKRGATPYLSDGLKSEKLCHLSAELDGRTFAAMICDLELDYRAAPYGLGVDQSQGYVLLAEFPSSLCERHTHGLEFLWKTLSFPEVLVFLTQVVSLECGVHDVIRAQQGKYREHVEVLVDSNHEGLRFFLECFGL